MTALEVAGDVSEVLAAVSAVALARRRPAHTRAAVALVVLALIAVVGAQVAAALTPPSVEPWQGWARVLVYLDGALNLATSATIAGLAVSLAVAPERRRFAVGAVVAVWALASIVLAALYPSPLVRGESLQRVYVAADLIGVFVSTVALVSWARAGIAAKRSPDSASAVAIGLVLLDLAILLTPFSPWRGSIIGGRFDVIQVEVLGFFAVISAAQVILWRFSAR